MEPLVKKSLKVALVDPSLFTAPYDAALTAGLLASDVQPLWLTRPTRASDRQEIPAVYVQADFYRHVDEGLRLPSKMRTVAKGLAHLIGTMRMVRSIMRFEPDIIHVQWAVLPPVDMITIWLLNKWRPVIFTVHDSVPYNGEKISLLQNIGFHGPIKAAQHLIVHTTSAKKALESRGIPASKISVIPHGPLKLPIRPAPDRVQRDPRYTLALFGEIKPYKGLDILVEALGRLGDATKSQLKVVVAGRSRMDLTPILARISELNLEPIMEIRAERQSEQQMADLFADCDCFVFPYRQIDASGVYFLAQSFQKWLIASRVGIFQEDMEDGRDGRLIPSESPEALALAIQEAVANRPTPAAAHNKGNSWEQIGAMTRSVYERMGH